MTLYELYAVQRDMNKLKSLYLELAAHEDFNPYKGNIITDMPKGNTGRNFSEWYTEKHEELLRNIDFYRRKIQEDRRILDKFIEDAPYPECDIIRFRVVNDLSWNEIGEELLMDRSTVSKKFYKYIKLSHISHPDVV